MATAKKTPAQKTSTKKTPTPTRTVTPPPPAPAAPDAPPVEAPSDHMQANLRKDSFLGNGFLGPTLPPYRITNNTVVLLNPDRVLRKETNGYLGKQLYEDMLIKDLDLAGLVELRMALVLELDMQLEPANQDDAAKRQKDCVDAVIEQISNWHAARENLYKYCMMTGKGIGEFAWVPRRGPLAGLSVYYGIDKIESRNPDRFVFEINDTPRLLTSAFGYESVRLRPRGFCIMRNRPTDENPHGFGWGEATYYHFVLKQNATIFWAQLLDKFGQPTLWGKYKKGTKTSEEQQALLDIISAIQNATAFVLPDDIILETIEAARSGSFSTYSEFVQWINAGYSMRLMSHTGANDTLQAPGVHVGQNNHSTQNRADSAIIARDARMLREFLQTQVIKPIVDVNFGAQLVYPRLTIKASRPSDAATEIAVIAGLKAVGCGPQMGIQDILKRMGYPATLPPGDEPLGLPSPSGAETGQPVGTGGTPHVTGQPESVRQRQPGEPKAKKSLEDVILDTTLTWARTTSAGAGVSLEESMRAAIHQFTTDSLAHGGTV